jgi:D-amino-acid dehydrogenase
VVPLGRDRIRVAGTAEFAGYDACVEPSRIAYLMKMLRRLYPAFALTVASGEIQPWTGFRPMSPDGVPIIGTTPVKNLFLNTGHGHFGWTVAAGSGKTVADIITKVRPAIDPQLYSLSRFA